VIMSLYILECFWLFRGDYELVLEEEWSFLKVWVFLRFWVKWWILDKRNFDILSFGWWLVFIEKVSGYWGVWELGLDGLGGGYSWFFERTSVLPVLRTVWRIVKPYKSSYKIFFFVDLGFVIFKLYYFHVFIIFTRILKKFSNNL
jgi:hypothetical protein